MDLRLCASYFKWNRLDIGDFLIKYCNIVNQKSP